MPSDFSDARRIVDDLGRIPDELRPQVRATVQRGMLDIKNQTRDAISTHPTWKRLASTVTYDTRELAGTIVGEVGYEDRGQGELAGIAEFGSSKKAPHPALIPSSAHEEPRIARALGLVKAFGL